MKPSAKNPVLDRGKQKPQPLYEQIRQRIRTSILESRITPGERLPTVSSLVREWSVHPRTVKSAYDLLEQDGLIRREPGKGAYVTHPQRPSTTQPFLFVRWSGDPFCLGVAEGIQAYAREIGAEAVIADADKSHENFLGMIAHPPAGTRGIIVMPFQDDRYYQAVEQAQNQGVKVVFVDRVLPGIRVSAVTADHYASGYQGTRHLIEVHGRPVYYIGTPASPTSQAERSQGWASAMQEHNFHELKPFLKELALAEVDSGTRPIEDIFRNPYQTARALFASTGSGPLSIFAGNDYIAKGVYMAAEEAGLRIGHDVFVASFGDMPLCKLLKPTLTSVRQDYRQIGYEAARLLNQELTGAVKTPIRRILPVELQVRESSIRITS